MMDRVLEQGRRLGHKNRVVWYCRWDDGDGGGSIGEFVWSSGFRENAGT